nr:protein phosphatase 2C family protein [Tanacetum cinerariifolium]
VTVEFVAVTSWDCFVILIFGFDQEQIHEVIKEDWDQKAVDGFQWKHKWEAMMPSSFERPNNEVLTEAATWHYFLERPKENTKCVSAADEELTAARHKLKLLVAARRKILLVI